MKKLDGFRGLSLPALSLQPMFGNHFHLILDAKGNILDQSDKWIFHHYSIARELKGAGHVRDYFDLPQPGPGLHETVSVRNHRDFPMPENPETFYTSFPNVILYLLGIGKNLYYATVRVIGVLPNIYLQRPNGIIYVDGRDRLAGFNQTFFQFFKEGFKAPRQLLNQPVSALMDPTPSSIQEARVAAAVVPDPVFMKELFAIPSGRAQLHVTPGARLEFEGEAVIFSNPEDNHATLTVGVPVPSRRDFSFEIDLTLQSGWHPLLTLYPKDAKGWLDEGREYSIGPDVTGTQSLLKKKGVVQRMGPAFRKEGVLAWRLHRIGKTLLFFENQKRLLAWHDPNYLHEEETVLTVELRSRSSCRITGLRLLSPETQPAHTFGLPVTRLKSATQNAFVINPMDNLSLSVSHPDLRGFVLENATEMLEQIEGLRLERRQILADAGLDGEAFIGKNPGVAVVREAAARAAKSDVTMLLQGETGTGKEVLAHFIHRQSPRKEGPFIKVDCATLPRELMESELFGHEKGAFTGAVEARAGLLAQANGGTLFLDEIGNLPRDVQAKLLHFLQDHTVTRIGGRHPVSIDVRVIAATNVPLAELVKRGEFRADLYYRMEVVSITLPALRDRLDDLPALCRHFIGQFNLRHGRKIRDFSGPAYERLYSHAWPGNVRELKNAVERAVIFCEGEMVPPDLLKLSGTLAPAGRKGRRPLKQLDREGLRQLFRKHGGVALKVAQALGVTPRALYDKIDKCGLTAAALRKPQ